MDRELIQVKTLYLLLPATTLELLAAWTNRQVSVSPVEALCVQILRFK